MQVSFRTPNCDREVPFASVRSPHQASPGSSEDAGTFLSENLLRYLRPADSARSEPYFAGCQWVSSWADSSHQSRQGGQVNFAAGDDNSPAIPLEVFWKQVAPKWRSGCADNSSMPGRINPDHHAESTAFATGAIIEGHLAESSRSSPRSTTGGKRQCSAEKRHPRWSMGCHR